MFTGDRRVACEHPRPDAARLVLQSSARQSPPGVVVKGPDRLPSSMPSRFDSNSVVAPFLPGISTCHAGTGPVGVATSSVPFDVLPRNSANLS